MTRPQRDEERLDVDYSERAGYLTGKSAALAEWRHRKDAKEFALYVRRLLCRRYYANVRTTWVVRLVENAAARAKRQSRRLARAAERPPCPRCGADVTRLGPTAKIPKYCSPKCMRAARFARWYARHGVERNARRRAT